MKGFQRLRLIIIISSVILLALMVFGVVLLIINHRLSFLDTLYEAIAFCIGIAGMLWSVVSQIDAYRQERVIANLNRRLSELTRESDEQLEADAAIKRQLKRIEGEILEEKKPHKR